MRTNQKLHQTFADKLAIPMSHARMLYVSSVDRYPLFVIGKVHVTEMQQMLMEMSRE